MKRISIHTSKYENELRDFAAKAAAAGTIAIKWSRFCEKRRLFGLGCVCADYPTTLEALSFLLMDIAEAENAVYRYSLKLRALAHGMRNPAICEQEVSRLRKFLRENKILHLEGYVTFRMDEYRDKLDMMIYSLVKKIRFSK